MTGAIKINGTYGVKIGNLQVFTYEGAVNAYKIFCELFNRDMTMEASAVMSDDHSICTGSVLLGTKSKRLNCQYYEPKRSVWSVHRGMVARC